MKHWPEGTEAAELQGFALPAEERFWLWFRCELCWDEFIFGGFHGRRHYCGLLCDGREKGSINQSIRSGGWREFGLESHVADPFLGRVVRGGHFLVGGWLLSRLARDLNSSIDRFCFLSMRIPTSRLPRLCGRVAARPPSLCRCAACCLSVLLEENRLTEVVTVWLTRPAGGKTVQPVVKKCLFFSWSRLKTNKAEKYGCCLRGCDHMPGQTPYSSLCSLIVA